MIIESIAIKNFGLFKGEHNVLLSPLPLNRKNITVISGQNGVGKSTLLEAIHLSLLGSLAIDSRLSEANYEYYLYKRAYRGQPTGIQESKLELTFSFVKSGKPIRYQVVRKWCNDISNVDEEVSISENGTQLSDLSKKEKNFFLRELVQPGFAKVMFFDGEKLSSLFEEANLTAFIKESCQYLFGLNFIELLKTDLHHYTNKLLSHQNTSQIEAELAKIRKEMQEIDSELNALLTEKKDLVQQLTGLKAAVDQKEDEISKQGRWATKKLDKLKKDRQQLETSIQNLKRELTELYGTLGPFVFCKQICSSLKERLLLEREIEKWQHAQDLLMQKAAEVQAQVNLPSFLNSLSIDKKAGSKLATAIKKILLSKPQSFGGDDKIYHEITDTERSKLIAWIDAIMNLVSIQLKEKSEILTQSEEQFRAVTKELTSFSKEDAIQPLLKELQELNKQIGSSEQKFESLLRRIQEAERRKDFYHNQYVSLQKKFSEKGDMSEKFTLAERTRAVLEEYSSSLLQRKLALLSQRVLERFNLLCRKQQYVDHLEINPSTFEIQLSKNGIKTEHDLLSAGEKQLLVLSFLWGLRELTNIALPLIIDTPLARLDSEHRNSFLHKFLPAMQPQVILIGTDMEITTSVIDEIEPYITSHYKLVYDRDIHANKIEEHKYMTESIAV